MVLLKGSRLETIFKRTFNSIKSNNGVEKRVYKVIGKKLYDFFHLPLKEYYAQEKQHQLLRLQASVTNETVYHLSLIKDNVWISQLYCWFILVLLHFIYETECKSIHTDQQERQSQNHEDLICSAAADCGHVANSFSKIELS